MKVKGKEVPPPPPVRVENQLNIAVIGGGVSGVMSAWELARSGHKVILIEKESLGNGSSQRSAACIRQQFGTTSTVRGMVYATSFFEHWEDLTGMEDSPIVQNGYLWLHDWRSDPRQVAEKVEMQQGAGLMDVRFLSQDDLMQQFDYVIPVGLTCATWCPTDGFLHPNIIYGDGAEAARRLGVEILQHTEITGVDMNDLQGITKIHTSNGSYHVDLVINTTNAWSTTLPAEFGVRNLPIDVRKRYLYFMDTKGLPEVLGEQDFLTREEFKHTPMIVGPNGCYSHPAPSGELMLGWLHNAPVVDPNEVDQDAVETGFGKKNDLGYGAAMRKETAQWHICVGEPGQDRPIERIESVVSGLYADTPDHNPIIGYDPNTPNVIHAVGFSGHGLMHAPFTARIVAELAAAGFDRDEIFLPCGIGEVDLRPYHVNRDFTSLSEGMVI